MPAAGIKLHILCFCCLPKIAGYILNLHDTFLKGFYVQTGVGSMQAAATTMQPTADSRTTQVRGCFVLPGEGGVAVSMAEREINALRNCCFTVVNIGIILLLIFKLHFLCSSGGTVCEYGLQAVSQRLGRGAFGSIGV